MTTTLDWFCGISWSLAYVVAVFQGFKRKTYCIPRFAVCMNFSWEFWVVISRIQTDSPLNSGFISQLLWLSLDVGVLISWLMYDKGLRRKTKLGIFVVVFGVVCLWAFIFEGWRSSVFIINLLMSIEFLGDYFRQGKCASSLLIALFKLVGTLAATVLNGLVYYTPVTLWIGGCCFILDMYYLFCLITKRKEVFDEKNKQQCENTF